MHKNKNIWDNVELVKDIIGGSTTVKEVLFKLNLPANTTNYRAVKNFCVHNNIDVPRISEAERIRRSNEKRSIKSISTDVFVENSTVGRKTVLRKAVAEGFLEYKCYGKVCDTENPSYKTWDNIVLQLEHKNGIGDDNRIENLELLCPNCHSQTETFGNKNKVRYENGTHGLCIVCGNRSKTKTCIRCLKPKRQLSSVSLEAIIIEISQSDVKAVAQSFDLTPSEMLKSLRRRVQKISSIIGEPQKDYKGKTEYPNIEELIQRIEINGYLKTAKEIGISDNGLRKHMKSILGDNIPSKRRAN